MRFSIPLLARILVPVAASAHAIGVDARLVGDKVRVEVYFDDDTPASGAKVEVLDGEKAVVAEGRTDDKGFWAFAKPKPGKYTVRLDAGDGHAAKTAITIPGEVEESKSLSEGPSRESFTGWQRLAFTGVGLAVIAGLTAAIRLVRRRT